MKSQRNWIKSVTQVLSAWPQSLLYSDTSISITHEQLHCENHCVKISVQHTQNVEIFLIISCLKRRTNLNSAHPWSNLRIMFLLFCSAFMALTW